MSSQLRAFGSDGLYTPGGRGQRSSMAWQALSAIFLLALVLALTVGLFGIGETLHGRLVPIALIVESVGVVVLLVTIALLIRRRRAA